MSRFADRRATQEVDLGPCECPGTPHDKDWAKVRSEYSGSDLAAIRSASEEDEAAAADALAPYVVEWNLLGPDGDEWPPDGDALRDLNQSTLTAIINAISECITASARVPNRSSGRSQASPRATASRTRTTRPTPGT